MYYTLLLCLTGKLQSWGNTSKFTDRQTWSEPSKSGVIGLIAAALGRKRDADISDLSAYRFGVRSDAPGRIIKDLQNCINERDQSQTIKSTRYCIEDATFLAAVESDCRRDLEIIDHALTYPRYILYLGRRSYLPGEDEISLGIRDKGLEEALFDEPWIASEYMKTEIKRKNKGQIKPLKISIESRAGEYRDSTKSDQPISFDPTFRKFSKRGYRILYKSIEDLNNSSVLEDHDIISEL